MKSATFHVALLAATIALAPGCRQPAPGENPPCASTADCPAAAVCSPTIQRCGAPCLTDADCADGEICFDGVCLPGVRLDAEAFAVVLPFAPGFFGTGSLAVDLASTTLTGGLDAVQVDEQIVGTLDVRFVALHGLLLSGTLTVPYDDGSTEGWTVEVFSGSSAPTASVEVDTAADTVSGSGGGAFFVSLTRADPPDARTATLSLSCGAFDVPIDPVATAFAVDCFGQGVIVLSLPDGATGCASDADCDDGDPCTIDLCDPATGACGAEPVTCDDGDPCTIDLCDPAAGGCVADPIGCGDGQTCVGGVCVPATGTSDLGVFQAVAPFVALRPDGFAVEVIVANRGPDPVADAVVTVTVPPDMAVALGPLPLGSGVVTVPVGPLAVGESVRLPLTTSDSDAVLVRVTSRVASGNADPDPTNDAYRSVVVMGRAPDGSGDEADLRTTATATPPRAVIARRFLGTPSDVTYEIVVANPGPAIARDVALSELLFGTRVAPMWLVDVIPSQGTCDIVDPRAPEVPLSPPVWSLGELAIPCELGDIPAGGAARVTILQGTGGPTREGVSSLAAAGGRTPDPTAGDNGATVVIPDVPLLGDVDGDGLVTVTGDRLAVFFCVGETVEELPICAPADVDGDGAVTGKDLSLVAQNQTTRPRVRSNSAPIEKIDNEKHFEAGTLARKAKAAAFDYLGHPVTKPSMLRLFGPVRGITELPEGTPTTTVGGGQHATFDLDDIPDDYAVGPAGCNTCIGVLVIPPDGTGLKAFHFIYDDDVTDVLEDAGPYEPGSRVVFCGGNNSVNSNETLLEVTDFFLGDLATFDILGYSDTDAIRVDNQGNLVTVARQDKASTNLP